MRILLSQFYNIAILRRGEGLASSDGEARTLELGDDEEIYPEHPGRDKRARKRSLYIKFKIKGDENNHEG